MYIKLSGIIMKFKNILIVSLFLAILTMGFVSASDNVTFGDVIAQNDSIGDLEITEDSFVLQNDENHMDKVEISESSKEVISGENANLEVQVPHILSSFDIPEIYASINYDAGGKMSMYVDNQKVKDDILNYVKEKGELPWVDLSYGKHTLELKYSGDGKYNPDSYSKSFYYSYFDVDYIGWNEYYSYFNKYGEGISLNNYLYLDEDIKLDMKVYIDANLVYDKKNIEESKTVTLNNLKGLNHTYKVVSAGKGKKYPALTIKGTFTRDVRPVVSLNQLMFVSTDNDLTFALPSDANGILKIYVNDVDVKPVMGNGKAKVSLKNLGIGINAIRVVYVNDSQYPDYDNQNPDISENYDVQVIGEGFKVTQPSKIRKNTVGEVIITGPRDVEGDVYIDSAMYASSEYINGTAKVSLMLDKVGVNQVNYTFSRNGGGEITGTFNVTVFPNKPIITANNFKADYSSKAKYKVNIKDKDYNNVFNQTVTFELYGYDYNKGKTVKIATKTAKTDKNGNAKVKFDVVPDDYKVKIKYGGVKVTKKYVVNSIVKPIQIYKKNSHIKLLTAKKFEFGASLKKVDGKILKGKKVKFTFYRQDYKGKINDPYWGRLSVLKTVNLKTDSKGIAKITYKKLPFKVTQNELEGVIILVKVSYLKDCQWVNLNVRSLSPIQYYFLL